MRYRYLMVIAPLLIAPSGLAFYLYRPSPAPDSPTLLSGSEVFEPQDESVDTGLLDENYRLREENARLQQELAEREQRIWNMTLEKLLEVLAPDETPKSDLDLLARHLSSQTPMELWASLEEVLLTDGESLTYSYDETLETLLLVMDIARKGDAGVRFLAELAARPLPDCERVTREEYDVAQDGQEIALGTLSMIRHESALKALLDVQNSGRLEEPLDLEVFSHHVSNLPRESVKPHVPAIYELIANAAKQPNLNRHYTEIAANLTFRLGHDRAYCLLTDPRVLGLGMGTALEVAAEDHSRRAYDFVRWVAENHEREDSRNVARDFLVTW